VPVSTATGAVGSPTVFGENTAGIALSPDQAPMAPTAAKTSSRWRCSPTSLEEVRARIDPRTGGVAEGRFAAYRTASGIRLPARDSESPSAHRESRGGVGMSELRLSWGTGDEGPTSIRPGHEMPLPGDV
jgi:hypothetical protein